jgi:hypothetical protein
MALVLQQLDRCSLACMAVTCSRLNRAVLASTSELEVRCSSQQQLDRFIHGLERCSTYLTNLSQCSIAGALHNHPRLHSLPGPQLKQLRLQYLEMQLGPADGSPGVLHDCSGLTALDIQGCGMQDVPAAAAAISALPGLQRLRLAWVRTLQQGPTLWVQLQHPAQLTHLSIEMDFAACTKRHLRHSAS